MTPREFAGALGRRLRAELAGWLGFPARARARLDGTRAAILMYHRVLPRAQARRAFVEPGMVVDPDSFRRHLECLAQHFDVRPLHEIAGCLAEGRPLPEGACAITFDDGWRDNLEHALPLLERFGLPATLFAVADRVGTPGAFWPDEVSARLGPVGPEALRRVGGVLAADFTPTRPEQVIERLKTVDERERPALLERVFAALPASGAPPRTELLDWAELDRLAAAGVDIEVHGASHAILTRLGADQARAELQRALDVLRARGHARHGLLAYPSGAWNAEVVAIAESLGYAAAVTTDSGLASRTTPLLTLPRIALHDDIARSRSEFLHRVPGSALAA